MGPGALGYDARAVSLGVVPDPVGRLEVGDGVIITTLLVVLVTISSPVVGAGVGPFVTAVVSRPSE